MHLATLCKEPSAEFAVTRRSVIASLLFTCGEAALQAPCQRIGVLLLLHHL